MTTMLKAAPSDWRWMRPPSRPGSGAECELRRDAKTEKTMTNNNHQNPSRVYVLALLTALSGLTFMDRQILALLQPIKQEFGFSDLQIGLITGLGLR
jgi:hypothetical protein